MQFNWKHVLPLALTSLVSFSSVVSADSDNAQTRNLENRVSALEQRKGASGMINPQGRPQVRDGADLFIFADLLYWNAHQNGMNVAVKQDDTSGAGTLDDAHVKSLRGKWNWGFRTGLGYNTMHDGWDIKLTWLRYTDTSHKTVHSGSAGAVYATQVMPNNPIYTTTNQSADKAHGYWSFNLNQLDLDLGREFFVSKWLTLRPHMGLRTDWIHQVFSNDYDELDASNLQDAETKLKDHWWGLGLAGGLDTQWGLGNGWSLFGNAGAAIVYGFHQIHDKQDNEVISTDVETTYANLGNAYRISHPILDFQAGIRWNTMFCNDRFHIGLQLGWEHHVYFSQNQFPLFTSTNNPGVFVSNQGDLTMQGYTFSARFDF